MSTIKSITTLLVAVSLLLFGVWAASGAAMYAATIPNATEPPKRRKLIWAVCVLGFWSLASIAYGMGTFAPGTNYYKATQAAWGFSLILVTTIPCGVPFFNQKWARPLRNLIFFVFGVLNIWDALR